MCLRQHRTRKVNDPFIASKTNLRKVNMTIFYQEQGQHPGNECRIIGALVMAIAASHLHLLCSTPILRSTIKANQFFLTPPRLAVHRNTVDCIWKYRPTAVRKLCSNILEHLKHWDRPNQSYRSVLFRLILSV